MKPPGEDLEVLDIMAHIRDVLCGESLICERRNIKHGSRSDENIVPAYDSSQISLHLSYQLTDRH
jgi:hypothetical protein